VDPPTDHIHVASMPQADEASASGVLRIARAVLLDGLNITFEGMRQRNETSVFEVQTCVYLGYVKAVDSVAQYCEATLRSRASKGHGNRIDERVHKGLCNSIWQVWDDMEVLFARRHIVGNLVPAKLTTDWAKRNIAREMSTILEALETRVIGVVIKEDRSDVEAALGWRGDLRALDEVFERPTSAPHPLCNWIETKVKKLHRLQEVMKDMVYSSRPLPRERGKVTPMDFVFAVALHNSAVHLAV
jgi:hypothetical protein